MTTSPVAAPRQDVRRQYEVLPYPHRDPARELDVLRQPTLCELPRLRSYLGARDLAGLRVLDAGCGTGDNTVFLAEQLRGSGAEVVALDFSQASLDINRARLAQRGLQGVRHVLASIEDAPGLGLGEFDVIVCTGVLHHLDSPEEGLRALRRLLAPGGVMALMVYARYGREPVYLVQALLQRLAPAALAPEQRLRILKHTLGGLPQQGRTLRGLLDAPNFRSEITQSDAGAYDLLLHTQDRPYTVPEVHAWMASAGMRVRDWAVPRQYDPATYLAGVSVSHLDAQEREAAAELMHGGMTKHEFFAERDDAPALPPLDLAAPDAVPAWCGWDFAAQIRAALDAPKPPKEFRCSFGAERDVAAPGDPLGRLFIGAVDATRTVEEILAGASSVAPTLSGARIRRRWTEFAAAFRDVGALALHPSDGRATPGGR
ncbi:MAG: class I SAM-dependent methyltransferase [Dehalococcoidia bacterium]